MEKVCKECGKRFVGRSDKLFCDDDCRNAYYNRRRQAEMKEIREVNAILRTNRIILRSLYFEGSRRVSRRRLEELHFDFRHFTAQRTGLLGHRIRFCYEYSYSLFLGRYIINKI